MSLLKHLLKTLLVIILGTAMAYWLMKYIAPLLAPFIVALFLTFFIEPVVKILQLRARMPRALAVIVSMCMVFGGLGLIIALAMTRLIVELVHLTAYLPEYIINIKAVALSIQNRAETYYLTLPKDVLIFINQKIDGSSYSLDSILRKVQFVIGKLLNVMLQFVSSIPIWVILIIISAIATYFFSKDKRSIINFWLKAIPAPWGRKSLEITKEIFQAIIVYIRVQLILITITLLQSLVGLYIIGAPYALLMGLVIGIADLIPVLGPSSIFIPWIVWEYVTGDSTFALKLAVLYGIVIVVRQILETKIVASSIGMHPLATMMAMYVGLKLAGPYGIIAGPLFIITLKAFASAGVIGWKDDS